LFPRRLFSCHDPDHGDERKDDVNANRDKEPFTKDNLFPQPRAVIARSFRRCGYFWVRGFGNDVHGIARSHRFSAEHLATQMSKLIDPPANS
jgi:hypothetical protein